MPGMRSLAAITALILSAPAWTEQPSGVTARLRGVSAISDRVAWASGSAGTVLRTGDGGATWQSVNIPGAEKLDFRDIDAVGEQVAYVLSIGSGESSRIDKTIDSGRTWSLQFTNADPKAFFDAMAFWDADRGVVVGGDYRKENEALDNAAITSDGGRTWTMVKGLSGFRSVVSYLQDAATPTLIAVGPQGADESSDDGRTWTPLPGASGLHAFAFAKRGRAGWGAGEKGRIMRLLY